MAPRAERPCVLSLVPGRVRLHLLGWQGSDAARIEDRLRRVPGVESVEANPRTGNALIRFDRRVTDEKSLLEEMYEAWASLVRSEEQREPGFLALPSSLFTPH